MSDNLNSIVTMVREDLAFLPADDRTDSKLRSKQLQTMYKLQSYFGKTDAEVEEETAYKPLERILMAKCIALEMILVKSLEISGGDASNTEDSGPQNSFLNKGKADVVEAGFEQIDINKTATLAMKIEKLIPLWKGEICETAYTLGLKLPYCGLPEGDAYKPFIFTFDC